MLVLFSSFFLLQMRHIDTFQRVVRLIHMDLKSITTVESYIFIYIAAALISASYAEAAMSKMELLWP